MPSGKFIIEEHAGIDRRSEIVRFGIPFSMGEWPKDQEMGIKCKAVKRAGKIGGINWDIVQRWEDKSVKLAFCYAKVDLDAQGILELEPDKASSSPAPSMENKNVEIECEIAVDSSTESCKLQIFTDKSSRTSLHNGQVELTYQLRTMDDNSVILSLTFRNSSNHPILLNRLRYIIPAEKVLNAENQPIKTQIGFGGSCRIDCEQEPQYLQLTQAGTLQAENFEPMKIQYPIGGECRQNYIWARAYSADCAFTTAVRNFGENFPCKLSLSTNAIFFDLWPQEAEPLTVPAGLSKTHQIGIVSGNTEDHGGGLNDTQIIHFPLIVKIPTDRLKLLECFLDFPTYCPEKYPKLEYWTKLIMANRPRAYGFMNFGDEPNFGYAARAETDDIFFTNNEYDFPLIALTEFCRTGERIWYEDGRAAVVHMMDIDSCTANDDDSLIGGQYSHSPNHTTHPPAPDHEWLEGLLMWYIIDGDERALQRAEALADRLAGLAEGGYFDSTGMTSRRYGWPLIALCSFYSFSRNQRYLKAASRIVEGMKRVEEQAGGLRSPYWGTPYWSLDTFMLGIAAAGLARYHKITEDQYIREMIIRSCDNIISLASPEGILYYKEYPMVRFPEPASSAIALEALAYGYHLTGNEKYIEIAYNTVEILLEQTRAGVIIDWNAEQRVSFKHGAYMRARLIEMNVQYIGIMLRGIWPFLSAVETAKFSAVHNDPRNMKSLTFGWK